MLMFFIVIITAVLVWFSVNTCKVAVTETFWERFPALFITYIYTTYMLLVARGISRVSSIF